MSPLTWLAIGAGAVGLWLLWRVERRLAAIQMMTFRLEQVVRDAHFSGMSDQPELSRILAELEVLSADLSYDRAER